MWLILYQVSVQSRECFIQGNLWIQATILTPKTLLRGQVTARANSTHLSEPILALSRIPIAQWLDISIGVDKLESIV